jgi:hypothetical protein
MLCCRQLKNFPSISLRMLFFYVFFVYNIHCTDKLVTKELSSKAYELNKHCSHIQNYNREYDVEPLTSTLKSVHPLETNVMDAKTSQISIQRLKRSSSVQKFTSDRRHPIHTNLVSSGLIQTISMDLQPDRDTFLPLNTQSDRRIIDRERRSPHSSYLSLATIHHDGLVINNDPRPQYFHDDVNYLHGVHQQHIPDSTRQWQQRLYSNIGDKISMQYIL